MNDFKDKVVYQIYPKSFMDSNGDGFGDLKGVTAKLDYLADLGVDYLWLTPFFPSPQRDNGYDVADYRAVDPRYGTMEDLEELIREADRRGIGLMLDMVFNHTSTEHEWFKKALAGDKKYQDYYIFKDGTPDWYPTNWVSKFGGPAWEYVPCLGKWYLHRFCQDSFPAAYLHLPSPLAGCKVRHAQSGCTAPAVLPHLPHHSGGKPTNRHCPGKDTRSCPR
jgi:trehalose-6-phosphate hydrolase